MIVGPNHPSGIGALVERQTRYLKLLHLPVQVSIALLLGYPSQRPGLCHLAAEQARFGRERMA